MKTFWNIALSVFFASLVVCGVVYLAVTDRITPDIPVPELFLLALAIFRLVRLFTYDAITSFIREWTGRGSAGSLRSALDALINCPWCTGLWFSAVVVFGYLITPYAWPVILILALAAIGSFFQVLSNLVGWHAEGKKKEVHRL